MYNYWALNKREIPASAANTLLILVKNGCFFITIELITGVLHGNGAHPFYY
jgi:hypothetical protein